MKKSVLLLAALPLMTAATPLQLKTHDFTELKVSGPLNVDYVCCPDSAGIIEIIGEASQVGWVEASGTSKRLKLVLKVPDEAISDGKNLPRVRVFSSNLSKVENDGDSTVRVLSAAPVAEFSARVLGNGRIGVRHVEATRVTGSLLAGHGVLALAGKCTSATLKLTGAGSIQADELRSKEATVWFTGTGTVGVNASETLSVKGSGSGTVYVVGAPTLKTNTIGIKIQPVE